MGTHQMYYDSSASRSPGSHRQPQPQPSLHRQSSRTFDAYGTISSGMYNQDVDSGRYDLHRYDRQNATIHSGYGAYDLSAQVWGSSPFNNQSPLEPIGATTRGKPAPSRGARSALPQAWFQSPTSLQSTSFPMPGSSIGSAPLRSDSGAPDMDEELIPTAIVIKNIPFAVKKEQLVQLMTELRLPLPYAFNYHFDNGVFRGLAFANFTTPEETAQVIEAMNHWELQGRKLRVEYKKMLPLAERERIEREKRERRGQLEEQHRPLGGTLHTQTSHSSLISHMPTTSPSPVSGRNAKPEVDLNDPTTLKFYSQMLIFKEDLARESMTFASTLTPPQRRTVHTLAHQMGLAHVSKGSGDQRQVHIFRVHDGPNMSPPIPQLPAGHANEPHRRGLNRAATTDFSDVRAAEGFYGTVGRQASGYLGFPDSPGGLTAAPNLRAAKSYADLRSYTPSPVPSTASYPVNRPSFSTFGNFEPANSNGSSLTPTTVTSMASREENLLVNGLGSMNIGSGFGSGGSPRGLRGMVSWDRENPGPIGGHRSFSTNFDDAASRDRGQNLPSRQPRGPAPERGTGFSRPRQNGHQGRNSDELSSQSGVEIVVE